MNTMFWDMICYMTEVFGDSEMVPSTSKNSLKNKGCHVTRFIFAIGCGAFAGFTLLILVSILLIGSRCNEKGLFALLVSNMKRLMCSKWPI